MQQSNGYIIGFSLALTIVCGGLLAGVYMGLKPTIDESKANDKRSQILSAYEPVPEGKNLAEEFDKNIVGIVTNIKGEIVEKDKDGNPVDPFKIDVKKQASKKDNNDKLFPVFCYKSSIDTSKFDAYIIPTIGNGLWDKIYGFVAIKNDFNTIKGAIFDHVGETPGLGARIAAPESEEGATAFALRFQEKKIYGENGDLRSVHVLKGEKNKEIDPNHEVDGLSGATMTTAGVNAMLENYFEYYDSFFQKRKKKTNSGKPEGETKDLRNLMSGI